MTTGAGPLYLRRDTAANWTSNNPTLKQGEPGMVPATAGSREHARVKFGDGTTTWSNAPYGIGHIGYGNLAGPYNTMDSNGTSLAVGFTTGDSYLWATKCSVVFGSAQTSTYDSSIATSPTAHGAFAGGFATGGGVIRSQNDGAIGGGRASGYSTAGSRIYSLADGGFAWGDVNTGGYLVVENGSSGSFVHGRVDNFGSKIYADNTGDGCTAWGYALNGGIIEAGGDGSTGFGFATYGRIESTGAGATAFGSANSNGGVIKASGAGSAAFGYSNTLGDIYATGKGAFAGGYSTKALGVQATGNGAFAFGHTVSAGYVITASGNGSLALGKAETASIVASAAGAAQFGSGTNAEAYTFAFGGSLRLNCNGAPSAKRNGDLWEASNAVVVRTDGVDVDLGQLPPVIAVCSDETTAITGTGTIHTFRMPHAMTVTEVRASLTTACTTGTFTVDINEAGVSILSTTITIDATEKTSTTAATPPAISDSALANDAEITIDVDNVGDSTATGLKVYLIGTVA